MFAFVDTDPQSGIQWADEGIALAKASTQPAARRWEATLRNNRGVALNQLKRHDEALAEFKTALQLTQADGKPYDVRVAHWMVANTLRLLGRLDEARDIQLRLEREWDEAKEPDPYVFEELETIYKAQGNTERAAHYAARLKASKGGNLMTDLLQRREGGALHLTLNRPEVRNAMSPEMVSGLRAAFAHGRAMPRRARWRRAARSPKTSRTTSRCSSAASPSVVHITTLATQRDIFSLNVQQVPRGTGTGFVWDDAGPRRHQFPRHPGRQAARA